MAWMIWMMDPHPKSHEIAYESPFSQHFPSIFPSPASPSVVRKSRPGYDFGVSLCEGIFDLVESSCLAWAMFHGWSTMKQRYGIWDMTSTWDFFGYRVSRGFRWWFHWISKWGIDQGNKGEQWQIVDNPGCNEPTIHEWCTTHLLWFWEGVCLFVIGFTT